MTSVMGLRGWAGVLVLGGCGVLHNLAAEAAEVFPAKPVRLVVPQAAGGGIDFMARLIGVKLSDSTGQSFVVDNRTGAGSTIGTNIVAKAAPDGYTLLANSISMAFNDTLYSKLPYDSIKDFSPVSLLAISANVLTVGPSSSAKTVQDLVQLAKSRPGKLNYGSGGIGGSDHVCSEYFQSVTGTKLVNVSYRGSAPALADLAAGMIEMAFAPIASGMPLITSGKLRALGVSTTKRAPLLPTVPTLIEAGVPKFDYSTWYGIWATGGVLQPVVAKLNSEIGKALQAVDVRERMAALGAEASWSNAQQFSAFYQSEIKRWEPLLRTFAQ